MKHTHNRVIKNFVSMTDPSVVTVPLATSKPRSFNAFICITYASLLAITYRNFVVCSEQQGYYGQKSKYTCHLPYQWGHQDDHQS